MRYRYRLFFVACFLFLLNGCATVPSGKAALPIQRFYINNSAYYPLSGVCEYMKLSWDYDAIGRQVTLRKADTTEVKLLIDSSMVLVNGYPVDIEDEVLVYNGAVVVPQKFKEKILDRFYCPAPLKEAEAIVGILRIKRVVIDAGHGGYDPGALGKKGLREKDVNLDITQRLSKILQSSGIEVSLTRSSDKFVSLGERSRVANQANADLFISIHSNSARSSRLNGFEVYYITENIDDDARAYQAAQNYYLGLDPVFFASDSLKLKATLWDMRYTQSRGESVSLAHSICQAVNKNLGQKILGVKGAPFYVLKGSHVPSVLIEVGFLSNAREGAYLKNPFYRQQIAEAIGEGILNYAKQCNTLGLKQ